MASRSISTAPARTARGDAVRNHLLDVAERLFAERGIDAVSLSSIAREANQLNASVMQYYFRSKTGVIEAILERRMEELNARRSELISTVDTADRIRALHQHPCEQPRCRRDRSADRRDHHLDSTLLHKQAPQLADLLIAARQRHTKPFVLCWLNADESGMRKLRDAGVCVVETTRGAIQAAAGLVQYGTSAARGDRKERAVRRCRAASTSARIVPSIQAAALLSRSGLSLVETRLARSADEAAQLAGAFGYPVAMKVESPDVPHKTDVGGVRLALRDEAQVRAAFDAVISSTRSHVPDATIEGVLVQRMADARTEIVLGLRRDPSFGPIVMVGLGGVFIEVLEDVVFGLPPLSTRDALDMISRLKAVKVLHGVRGQPAVNLEAIAAAICALSRLADEQPDIVELDVNPLFAGPDGVMAVDWLMVKDQARASGR